MRGGAVSPLVTHGPIATSYNDKKAVEAKLELDRHLKNVTALRIDMERKATVSYEAAIRADNELDAVLVLKKKLKEAVAQSEGPEANQEESIGVIESLNSQLSKQLELEKRERKVAQYARKELDNAELVLQRNSDLIKDVEARVAAEQRTLQKVTTKKLASEEATIMRLEATRNEKASVLSDKMEEIKAKARKQIERSIILNQSAREKLAAINQHSQHIQQDMDTVQKTNYDIRANAFMKLKRSIAKASSDIQSKNEHQAKEERKRTIAENTEKAALYANGENPYEVFRRRRLDADAKKQYVKLVEKSHDESLRIGERMINEDEYLQKQEDVEEKHRRYKKKYQSEMGRSAKEARLNEYMTSKTKGGSEFVSMTGTQKVEPSNVTVIKDHSFGFGKAATERPDIVEMIRNKPTNKGVTMDPLFVPKMPAKATWLQDEGKAGKGELLDELLGMHSDVLPGASASYFSRGGDDPPTSHDNHDIGGMAAEERAEERALEGSSTKKFPPPKLSVLEQKMMADARVRQRENIVYKQVVWGKEFVGTAFLSDPACIIFEDFTVDVPMTQTFTLTNVSNTFNNFTVHKLPDEVIDFFEIFYDKPGRMSAGMTCTLTITFSPKINRDIDTAIPFLAKTGAFSIPLKCLTKKAVPKVSVTTLDMGLVTMGEDNTMYLEVVNEGALDVNYEIQEADPEVTEGFDADETVKGIYNEVAEAAEPASKVSFAFPENVANLMNPVSTVPVLQYVKSGTFSMFSTNRVKFLFTPNQIGTFKKNFILRYSDKLCPNVKLTVKARGVKVPIFVDNPLIDFKCCISEKLYRSKLLVRNRGSVALQATLKPPPCLESVLEFIPSLGFVQGFNSSTKKAGLFEFQIKFRPTMDLLKSCAEYYNAADDAINVPIQLHLPDQTLPVYFTLRAQLTTSDVTFDPPSINFGKIFSSQGVNVPLKITNTSALPQRFGFIHMPSYISIVENEGFGTLLPKETIVKTINFAPPAAADYSFHLNMMTSMNRNFSISCKGEGALPPLHFSHSVIKFGPTSVGDVAEHSIIVANKGKKKQTFEFVVPHPLVSQLKISPLVESLEAGQSCRVVVEFIPTPESDDVKKLLEPVSSLEGVVEYSSAITPPPARQHEAAEELWSRHATWRIPCFLSSDGSKAATSERNNPLLFIQASTTTIRADVVADSTKVNFGQVSMGRDSTFTVRIRNNGDSTVHLTKDTLNAVGPFSVVNSCRDIPPKQSFPLLIQFKPSSQRIFNETLLVATEKGKISIVLVGEGVSPSYTVDPKDGKLDFGHVLVGSESKLSFKLKNCSVFPLQYTIDPQGLQHSNFCLREVFTVVPAEAILSAGQEQEVTVSFLPDHERPVDYVTEFHINVANQKETQKIIARGRCWTRQAFATASTAEDISMMAESDKIEDFFAVPGAALPPSHPSNNIPLRLQFPKDSEPGVTERYIYVGSAFSEKGGAAGSFDIKLPDNAMFTCDILKGATTIGKPTKITFKQKPPAVTNSTDGELRVGQIVKNVAQIVLRGGYVPPGANPEQTVDIILRGYTLT